MTPRRRLVALALLLVILCAAATIVLAAHGTLTPSHARRWADDELVAPVDDLGAAGPLLFVAVFALLTVVLLPGAVTCGLAGLLFGTALGFPTALAGIVVGACLAFALARWWAHDAVVEIAGPRLQGIRAWIGDRGFRSVLFARVTPGLPFNLVNYAAGLTPVSLASFAGATTIGAAPRVFAYTALGGSLGNLRSPEALIAVGVLIVTPIVGVSFGVRERRRSVAR